MEVENSFPLVSVCVISYNSSATIIETLDSIKNQTYGNTELIISDDCSKDDTVKVVKEWIDENKNCSLKNINLIANEKNGGTCKNLNTAINASFGKYIKILAADDLLVPEAIEEFADFCEKNKCDFCVSDIEVFSNTNSDVWYLKALYRYYFDTLYKTYKQKKKNILIKNTYPGPSYFFTRSLFDSVKGFDEKYDLAEEWQFCFHALYNGFDILPLQKKLVKYRVSDFSVSRQDQGLNKRFIRDDKMFFDNEVVPKLKQAKKNLSILNRKYIFFVDLNIDNKLLHRIFLNLSPINFFNTLVLKIRLYMIKI